MDEIDKNLPDDFWRKAFEEAAETPPKRVWAAIEQRLDESAGPKVVPLWGMGLVASGPFKWATGLAASLALLLVGWWLVNSNSVEQPAAHQQAGNHTQNVAATRADKAGGVTSAPVMTNVSPEHPYTIASTHPLPSAATPTGALAANQPLRRQNMQKMLDQAGSKAFQRMSQEDVNLALSTVTAQAMARVSQPSLASFASSHSGNSPATSSLESNQAQVVTNAPLAQPEISFLAGKPLRMRRPGNIQRIVWVRPAELGYQPEESKAKRPRRELWASVSMMPGSFNPAVSIQSAQPALTNSVMALAAPSSSAAVNSRANYSVAYQAGAGVQLSERWSVESGIGYLSGRSTVEAPGTSYSASAQQDFIGNRNSVATNAYVDALRNSVHTQKLANNAPQASYSGNYNNVAVQASYDSKTLQAISNDYQFVQVPVQVGYQLRPRKKLSMAVLGGLLANVFVRNTVGNTLVVTSKDGVYRPVALAATMGARLRYRPTRQWSASVSGVYQPSLESVTQTDAQVQSHPTSAGMSFGVDYHF